MFNNDSFSSRPVVNVPVDAGDDAVVVTVSVVKALRIDARAGLVIIVLDEAVIRGLVDEKIGVVMLVKLDIVVIIAATDVLRFRC